VARVPNIFEQVFRNGDSVTGVAFTGSGGGDGAGGPSLSADKHVYRQTPLAAEGAIVGGLIPIGGSDTANSRDEYLKLVSIYVYSHTATSIRVIAVDTDGFEHILGSSTTDTYVDDLLNDFMLLPGWNLKVVTNAVGTNGAKIVVAFDLWFNRAPFVY